jgi:predicted  nucleic acid-binding Zn-ribbon protein
MTTVAVVFGVVALVSIAINIYFRLSIEGYKLTLTSKDNLIEDYSSLASKNESEIAELEKRLTDANKRLKKWERKRDPETGKIVKG